MQSRYNNTFNISSRKHSQSTGKIRELNRLHQKVIDPSVRNPKNLKPKTKL